MERIGLSNDEIRLIGGFRGLTEQQREAMLSALSAFVIGNARAIFGAVGAQ